MDADVDVDDILQSPTSQVGRTLVLYGVSLLCKLALNVLNTTTAQVPDERTVQELLLERDEGTPLITVANHTSTLDDPCIPCALLPQMFFATEAWHEKTRWVFCAESVCFKNAVLSAFFKSGKGLSVRRGAGQDQPSLHAMARRLASHGDWLHVFPEGRISYNGKIADLRWGIGKMVCDVMLHSGGKEPVVLPYYHTGMGDVFPYKARLPRVGHDVKVLFGEPLDLSDLTCNCNKAGVDQQKVWQEITGRVRAAMVELEDQSDPNTDQINVGRAPQRHESGHDRSTII